MKKPLLFLFFSALCIAASAQKAYYIYFQSEEQAPFYVKFKDKVFNSGSAGYVIIPNLQDSTYRFILGFSSNTSLEAKYSITIDESDRGFVLKKFDEGPALFDLQNVALIKPEVDNTPTTPIIGYETKTDKFSTVLSKAAEDPSLVKVPILAKKEPEPKVEEPKKVEEVKESVAKTPDAKNEVAVNAEVINPIKPDSSQTKTEVAVEQPKSAITPSEQTQTSANVLNEFGAQNSSSTTAASYRKSYISRYSETSTTEGFGAVYYDIHDGQVDTIQLLIPNSKYNIAQNDVAPKQDESMFLEIKKETPAKQETEVVKKKKKKKEEEIKAEAPVSSSVPPADTQIIVVAPKTSTNENTNAACQALASDKDFFKLRKSMAGKETDESMIEEARKYFRKECFTTEQIRNLSALFLTSAGKYQFFDAAFNYSSDKQNFSSLESEIRDAYYLKRFKALVGE